MPYRIKRVYEPATPSDGARVLVDRLWPRGVSKANAHLSEWLKEVAPSAKLRVWFDHRPERFAEFSRRYKTELRGSPALAGLRKLGRGKAITLVYGAHDPKINHAAVLLWILQRSRKLKTSRSRPRRSAARPHRKGQSYIGTRRRPRG